MKVFTLEIRVSSQWAMRVKSIRSLLQATYALAMKHGAEHVEFSEVSL